jgi:hypothetical protein
MPQEVSRRPLTATVWDRTQFSVRVCESLMDKVAQRKAFSTGYSVLRCQFIPPWLSLLFYHMEDE